MFFTELEKNWLILLFICNNILTIIMTRHYGIWLFVTYWATCIMKPYLTSSPFVSYLNHPNALEDLPCLALRHLAEWHSALIIRSREVIFENVVLNTKHFWSMTILTILRLVWLDRLVHPNRIDAFADDVIGLPGGKREPARHDLGVSRKVSLQLLLQLRHLQ